MAAKKIKGFMVLPAVLMSILLGLLGVAFLQIFSGQFTAMAAGRKALQALQYAQSEADSLRNLDYDNIATSGAHSKQAISGTSGWQSEVTLGPETTVNDVKQRIATVNVYRNGTGATPDFSLQVPLSSLGGIDKLPVGTILPYNGSLEDIPKKWALCDGKNGTPNLTGRFLQGWGSDGVATHSVGQSIEAGLPNITGTFTGGMEAGNYIESGALYFNGFGLGIDAPLDGHDFDNITFGFDASRCDPIYGKSKTVQPRAYVVQYIMKIKK